MTYGRKLKTHGDLECSVELWKWTCVEDGRSIQISLINLVYRFPFDSCVLGIAWSIHDYVLCVFCVSFLLRLQGMNARDLYSRFLNCLSFIFLTILFFFFIFYLFLPVFSIDISLILEIFSPPEEEFFILGTWLQLGGILLNYRESENCLLTLFLGKQIFCMRYNRDT